MDNETLKLSWSRIRLHSECPQKGHLTSLGRRSPVSDHRTFFPGTVTDRCMRQWLSLEVQERGWMAAQVDRIMDEEEAATKGNGDGVVRWKTLQDRAQVREFCKSAVHQLESDLLTQLHLLEPPHYDWDPAPRFEVPITIPHPSGHKEQIMLRGEIDLLIQTPAGIEVWDLKTTKDNSYWRKTIGQLVFYEIAVWGMGKGWPVRSGLLQPLCDETTPCWQFTQDHRMQMFQRIVAVAHDIWSGRLDPKVQPACKYCDVRHACPAKGGGSGRVTSFRVPQP